MNALIIDDETKARDMLQYLLSTFVPEIKQIRQADGGRQAHEKLAVFHPDLVFLDIQMPDQDGFSWLKEVENKDFTLIFTTAYDQYAIRAIRFSAFDYLLKPIEGQDLRRMIDRLKLQKTIAKQDYAPLFYNTSQANPNNFRLKISTTEGTHFLDPKEIMRCEADGNYTFFFIINGDRIIASKPIGIYADLLDDFGFIRCHKSHLINARFVLKYTDLGLSMKGGILVEVSRRRRKEVRQRLNEFIQTSG